MRVSDLAKELGITTDVVLAKLKSLHLKAKDGKQELSAAVLVVLKSELNKLPKSTAKAVEKPKEEKVQKAEVKSAAKPKSVKATKEKVKKEGISTSKKTKTAPVSTFKKAVKSVSSKKGLQKELPSAQSSVAAELKEAPKLEKKDVAKVDKPIDVVPRVEVKKPDTPIHIFPTTGHKAKQPVPQKETPAQAESKAQPAVQPLKPLEELEIQVPISIKDLAVRLQQKPSIVLKQLLQMGIFANINQSLDEEVVKKLTVSFGFSLIKVKTKEEQLLQSHQEEQDDPKFLKTRSPVVTFMGHVDHGKTSLLDRIRKSKVVDQEHGGITQHMGAYSVNTAKGKITFLDTPGHEAFTSMRARGAHITDIVVLVVAADEGIMPQTEEAIDHAKVAAVPIVVALNKIDKKNIDLDRVKKQLADHDLAPEDWGGKTICIGVSAVTGEGIDTLLEMIALEGELLELKANYEKKASGIVVEAQLSRGKGPVATVIVQNGTLREGDVVVVGPYFGKIKAMFDDREKPIKEAGPATPVEILGLSDVPEAGEIFYVVEDEKQGRDIAAGRQQQIKAQKMQPAQKITLEDLYSQIQAGKIKELNIILKADVQGSLEALRNSLEKIPNDEVKLRFIHMGVGEINASDAILAGASNAIIIGFHVEVGERAKEELEKRPVDVRTYRIIYDAINDIRNALSGLLEPKTKKKFLGRIEIKQVMKLSKSGIVAGCSVQKGKVNRKANIDLVRNGEVVFSGTLSSLKRFKDDVKEVTEGFECGITINGYTEIQPGDVIEAYELEKIARTL